MQNIRPILITNAIKDKKNSPYYSTYKISINKGKFVLNVFGLNAHEFEIKLYNYLSTYYGLLNAKL